MQHGSDDAYFLFVAHGEIAYKCVLSEDFSVHEAVIAEKSLMESFIGDIADFGYETEVFFGSEVVDKESRVDKGTGVSFPVFRLGCVARDSLSVIDAIDGDATAVGFEEVEDEAEECGLACPIIADKTYEFAAVDGVAVDVQCLLVSEGLCDIFYG